MGHTSRATTPNCAVLVVSNRTQEMAPSRGFVTSLKSVALALLLLLAHAAPDPYSVLGVGRSASDDEIKRAYRKAALKYHPDKAGTAQAAMLWMAGTQQLLPKASLEEHQQRNQRRCFTCATLPGHSLCVQNPKGQKKFVEVQQAYEILGDPQRKRRYDLGGHAAVGCTA